MASQNWSHYAASVGIAAGTALVIQRRLNTLQERETRLEDAREDYHESLRELADDPGDQALKEEAFIRGIVYAGLMRDAGREREFDEETATEDIQRALRLGQAPRSPETASAVARLRELAAMWEAGLITEKEYRAKRLEILAGI